MDSQEKKFERVNQKRRTRTELLRAARQIIEKGGHPSVAEVADFLLRLDQVEWAAAIGTFGSSLHCSIRTTDREVNAGDLLQRVLGAKSAGGHDMIAGGRIPVSDDPALRERTAAAVRDRLLRALGIDPSRGEPLVPQE